MAVNLSVLNEWAYEAGKRFVEMTEARKVPYDEFMRVIVLVQMYRDLLAEPLGQKIVVVPEDTTPIDMAWLERRNPMIRFVRENGENDG